MCIIRRLNLFHHALFLGSLLVCLWFGQLSLDHQGLATRTSDAADATQLTQQGWQQYQRGDVQGAIAQWQAALSLASDPSSELRATILTYLVRADQQIGAMDQAIAHLAQLITYYRQTGNPLQIGRRLTEQAQAYTSLGQQRRAIALLCGEVDQPCVADSAVAIARHQEDTPGKVAALGSLGNAYRLRGDYDRALQHLTMTLKLARQLQSLPQTLAALNGLGNTYTNLAQRDDRRRQSALQSDDETEAQSLAQTVSQYDRKAIDYFAASVEVAHAQADDQNELRSLLNLVVPLQRRQVTEAEDRRQKTKRRMPQSEAARAPASLPGFTPASTLQRAQSLWENLPASREKAYAAIRLATLSQLMAEQTIVDPATHCFESDVPQVISWLQQAIAIAQQIHDPQSEAFALGRLGHVYECRQDYDHALTLTQQAQLVAANHDSRYLWEWQSGRILRAQRNIPAAINAYTLAVKTLQTLRGELANASRDFQFDFRDTVEPVYRELTALYLEQATSNQKQAQRQLDHLDNKGKGDDASTLAPIAPIESALETIDRLRLAELQNYLGEDCTLSAIVKPVTVIDPKTAVLSSIILGDKVAMILTLPTSNQHVRSQVQWLPVQAQTVRETINDLRRRLEKRSDLEDTYQERSQQVYDWLIRPFAQSLQTAQIETLVFIQDGILRSVPMAALYDGKQFLVEQYAIASTLSLTLIDPMPLDRANLRVLGFGLTKPAVVEGPTFFAPLSYVKAEIASIQDVLPGSKGLLDDAFTLDRVQQELTQNAYPIVHLATHGRFGIDARDTFLVTGKQLSKGTEERREVRAETEAARPLGVQPQSYNEKLTMNALYRMLRSVPQETGLELLTLTACETAVGSDRDALGIAGISLQAGARSTVASLWQVDDAATAHLITHFYQSLKQGMSRAKALQVAQKTWLQQHTGDRHHPGYWAALILVGNWL